LVIDNQRPRAELGYAEDPWKGPGLALLVVADLQFLSIDQGRIQCQLYFFQSNTYNILISHRFSTHRSYTSLDWFFG